VDEKRTRSEIVLACVELRPFQELRPEDVLVAAPRDASLWHLERRCLFVSAPDELSFSPGLSNFATIRG
jgi:hypothetical protein